MGTSIGKYDGDALIIDTAGFNGKTWIDTAEHPSSDALHVIERIRYIDPQHLSYEVTWEDPKTYTKPIANSRVFAHAAGTELMEWWCMENPGSSGRPPGQQGSALILTACSLRVPIRRRIARGRRAA
jgi:hypothetical protein